MAWEEKKAVEECRMEADGRTWDGRQAESSMGGHGRKQRGQASRDGRGMGRKTADELEIWAERREERVLAEERGGERM